MSHLAQNPTAARLLEFLKALVPKGTIPVETALFDDLLNYYFNSFSDDNSLSWLLDL